MDVYLQFQDEFRSDASFFLSGVHFVLGLQVTIPLTPRGVTPGRGILIWFVSRDPNRLLILLLRTKLFNRVTQEHKIPAF